MPRNNMTFNWGHRNGAKAAAEMNPPPGQPGHRMPAPMNMAAVKPGMSSGHRAAPQHRERLAAGGAVKCKPKKGK